MIPNKVILNDIKYKSIYLWILKKHQQAYWWLEKKY